METEKPETKLNLTFLKEWRKERKITRDDFVTNTTCCPQYLGQIERGTRNPKKDLREKFYKAAIRFTNSYEERENLREKFGLEYKLYKEINPPINFFKTHPKNKENIENIWIISDIPIMNKITPCYKEWSKLDIDNDNKIEFTNWMSENALINFVNNENPNNLNIKNITCPLETTWSNFIIYNPLSQKPTGFEMITDYSNKTLHAEAIIEISKEKTNQVLQKLTLVYHQLKSGQPQENYKGFF